jgi:hypothetical protein
MTPEASRLVIDIAKALIGGMRSISPAWQRAFYRFNASDTEYGATGSYVTGKDVTSFDSFCLQPPLTERAVAATFSVRQMESARKSAKPARGHASPCGR